MNGKKILAGKSRDQFAFWIDKNVIVCKDDVVVSEEITIQNEEIIQSACDDHLNVESKF